MSEIAEDFFGNRIHIDNADRFAEYFCPICGERMSQRRGPIRIDHFAHYPGSNCRESWASDEGEWHKSWKDKFPVDCREIVIKDDEHIHRADVVVNNTVIEFQHSRISEKDFHARNKFYKKHGYNVVWIFDCINKINEAQIRDSFLLNIVPWPTSSNPVPESVHQYRTTAKEKVFIQTDENTLYEIMEANPEKNFFIGHHMTGKEFITKVVSSCISDDHSEFMSLRKIALKLRYELNEKEEALKNTETEKLRKEAEIQDINRKLRVSNLKQERAEAENNELRTKLNARIDIKDSDSVTPPVGYVRVLQKDYGCDIGNLDAVLISTSDGKVWSMDLSTGEVSEHF